MIIREWSKVGAVPPRLDVMRLARYWVVKKMDKVFLFAEIEIRCSSETVIDAESWAAFEKLDVSEKPAGKGAVKIEQ